MKAAGVLLWVLIGGLGLAFIVLLVGQNSGTTFGLPNGQFAQAAAMVSILAFVSVGLLGRGVFARSVRHAIAWVAVLMLLVGAYTYRNELEWVGRRMTAELLPGRAIVEQPGEAGGRVIISRRVGGHFGVFAAVNDTEVPMMIDTGASIVTLTAEDARAAGLDPRDLRYSVPVATANGTARAAPVVLDSLTVGSIERRRVPALVAQPGMLENSLLGMSFLDTLGGFTIRGDRLELMP